MAKFTKKEWYKIIKHESLVDGIRALIDERDDSRKSAVSNREKRGRTYKHFFQSIPNQLKLK